MCNCLNNVHDKLKEKFPDISKTPNNFEFCSGRQYATYGFDTAKRGRKDIMILYSYCPFCGERYSVPGPMKGSE